LKRNSTRQWFPFGSEIGETHGNLTFFLLLFPFENESVDYKENAKNNDISASFYSFLLRTLGTFTLKNKLKIVLHTLISKKYFQKIKRSFSEN